MSRFRAMSVTTGLFLFAAAVAINGWAQGPGGGGRGGGFGGRGFGGPFGGDSLLSLALRPPVQDDLKVSEKQKSQLISLNEDFNQRRQKLMESMRQNWNGGGNDPGGTNRNANNGGHGNSPANAITNNFGRGSVTTPYEINPYALNASRQPNQQAQQPQQDDRQARFQAMRQSMAELDQQASVTLARILSSKQFQRLDQIQIQAQGINALVRPDVAEKIQLDEAQLESIQAVINDRRTAQREVFSKQGNLFRSFRNQNGGAANGNNQRQADAAPNGNAPPTANGGQANTVGGAGNGRRGGPGGFDREAMKKFMEQPEVKAQMEQTQLETARIDSNATKAAYQIMTKYQVAAFKKLQGPPFEVGQLRPNFGGPGGNRNGTAPKSATASSPEKAEASKETANPAADAKKPATSKAKSKAKSSSKKRSYSRQPTPSEADPDSMDLQTGFE